MDAPPSKASRNHCGRFPTPPQVLPALSPYLASRDAGGVFAVAVPRVPFLAFGEAAPPKRSSAVKPC